MQQQTKLELTALISYICKYPIFLFEDGKQLGEEYFLRIMPEKQQFTSPFLCDEELTKDLLSRASDEPQIVREGEHIHYGLKRILPQIVCILGPIGTSDIPRAEIREYARKHHVTESNHFFMHKASRRKTMTLLSVIHYCLTGEYEAPPIFNGLNAFSTPEQEKNETFDYKLLNYQLQNADSEVQHIPYLVEKKLMSAVTHGNVEELKEVAHYNIMDYSLGTLAHTTAKQMEYQAVVTATIAARAAIEGGLNPMDVYDLNDLYLQKISTLRTSKEYQGIMIDMLLKYCSLVKKAQAQEPPTMHVGKCKHYVANHLNKPYNMQDLADYVGLSAKYLGDLFRKTEGQTLKSYILQSRIEAAKNMLKYSDYPLSQIASYFCFDSQSHFGATFRKFEGMSPSEYRRQNKPAAF